jgi:hypothetical protein
MWARKEFESILKTSFLAPSQNSHNGFPTARILNSGGTTLYYLSMSVCALRILIRYSNSPFATSIMFYINIAQLVSTDLRIADR